MDKRVIKNHFPLRHNASHLSSNHDVKRIMNKRGAAAVTPTSFLMGSRQSKHPTPSPSSPTMKKVRCPEVVKYTVSKADNSGLAGLLRTHKSDSENPFVLAAYYGHVPLVQVCSMYVFLTLLVSPTTSYQELTSLT